MLPSSAASAPLMMRCATWSASVSGESSLLRCYGEIGAAVDLEDRAPRLARDRARCVEQAALFAQVGHGPSCIIAT